MLGTIFRLEGRLRPIAGLIWREESVSLVGAIRLASWSRHLDYDLLELQLGTRHGPVLARHEVAISLLLLEYLSEGGVHLQLIVRSQDFDLFKLVVLLSDATELEACEEGHVEDQGKQSQGREDVAKSLRKSVVSFCERKNGDIVAIFQSPLDVEAILSNENLAKGPLIDHVSVLGHVRVLILQVPEAQIAEGGAQELVDFREEFELGRWKVIVDLLTIP